MYGSFTQFGAEQAGGIAALGLNVQSFFFQLITFVLVLILLRKYAYKPLVGTLEKRRQAVIESLEAAQKAAKDLEKSEEKVAAALKEARGEASAIVETAHREAAAMIADAEEKAGKKSDHLIAQAEARLKQDIEQARIDLKKETLALVALATEKVAGEAVGQQVDKRLIESAIEESRR